MSEKIGQLKLEASDGKKYLTDVADTSTLLRIIQSIPSPKAEPLKRWLAEIGAQRLEEIENPEFGNGTHESTLRGKRLSPGVD